MAEDQGNAGGGGGPLQGPPIAGIPRPVAIGAVVVGGAALLVWWWKKHEAAKSSSSSTSTVITGSSSTGLSNAALDAILKNWQQHPATTSSSTAASGTGTGGGSAAGGGGGASTASGTGTGAAGASTSTTAPTSPGASTTTNESGQMHGITTAQAQYLFDTGNQPYVYDAATNQYVRWSGMPVAGQTYYAGPLNWQDALQNGNVIGGTKGHPVLKSSSTPAKKEPAKKPAPKKTPAKK